MGWFSVLLSFSSGYFLGSAVPSLARFESFSRCNPRNWPPFELPSNFTSEAPTSLDLFPFFLSFTSQPTLLFSFAIHCCARPTFIFPTFFSPQHPLLGSAFTPFFCATLNDLCALSLTQSAWQTPQLRKTVSSSHCRRQHGTHIKPNHVLDY